MVYERYATEEQILRSQAVEALRKYEEELFGKVKAIEVPKEMSINDRPKEKMIRLTPEQLVDLTEEDKQIALWTQQTGAEIDRDHQRFLEEAKAEQAAANERVRRFIAEGSQEGMLGLADAQAKFDHEVHQELDLRYQKGKKSKT